MIKKKKLYIEIYEVLRHSLATANIINYDLPAVLWHPIKVVDIYTDYSKNYYII